MATGLQIATSRPGAWGDHEHDHTAAARAKSLTEQHYTEFLAVVGLASTANAIVTGLQIPVDPEFLA